MHTAAQCPWSDVKLVARSTNQRDKHFKVPSRLEVAVRCGKVGGSSHIQKGCARRVVFPYKKPSLPAQPLHLSQDPGHVIGSDAVIVSSWWNIFRSCDAQQSKSTLGHLKIQLLLSGYHYKTDSHGRDCQTCTQQWIECSVLKHKLIPLGNDQLPEDCHDHVQQVLYPDTVVSQSTNSCPLKDTSLPSSVPRPSRAALILVLHISYHTLRRPVTDATEKKSIKLVCAKRSNLPQMM